MTNKNMKYDIKLHKSEEADYIKAIISVAKIDGIIHEKEKEFIEAQAKLLSIDIAPYWEKAGNDDLSYLCDIEMSRITRFMIIRDCITLGYIDGKFEEKERNKIVKIASYLKLTKSDVENVELWLKEFWEILDKGMKLFNADNQ